MVIQLTDKEIARAFAVADERQASKERAGVASKKHGQRSDRDTHRLGLLAEYAVAKALSLRVNEDTLLGGDGGVDFVLERLSVDVKMRDRRGRDLIAMPDLSDFRADVAVLCWPGDRRGEIEIVGCASRGRFCRYAQPINLPYGPRLLLDWRKLRKL